MKPIEIIAIIVSVLIVISVIIKSVINKKKGKTGCGCGCSSCPRVCSCKKTQKREEEIDGKDL